MCIRKRQLRVGGQRLTIAPYRVVPPAISYALRKKLLRQIAERLTGRDNETCS